MLFRLFRRLLRSRRWLTTLALLGGTGIIQAQIPPKNLLPPPVRPTAQAQSQPAEVHYPIAIAPPQHLLPTPTTSTYQASPPGSNATGLAGADATRLAAPDATGLAVQPEVAPIPAPAAATQPATTKALTLEECVAVALQRQPSIAAARATLASAETNRAALHKLFLVGLLARDLHIRQQQSDLGVTIARAGLMQAEWDTRYAVTRCYWGWVYAREQEKVIGKVITELKTFKTLAEAAIKAASPDVDKLALAKIDLNVEILEVKRSQAVHGTQRALAALREAMGLEPCDMVELVPQPLPEPQEVLNRCDLLKLALERRGELTQAMAAASAADLEISAQHAIGGLIGRTFAMGSDIHSRPIPPGISNKEYRPGAIGPEMPVAMGGRRHDRVQRAQDLSVRATAVVEKTRNLIALELDDAMLKWAEATSKVKRFRGQTSRAEEVLRQLRNKLQGEKAGNSEEILRSLGLFQEIAAGVNDGLYEHVLAVAALERITAGGFIPRFRPHLAPPAPPVFPNCSATHP